MQNQSLLPPIFQQQTKKMKKKTGYSPALGAPYYMAHHGHGSHSPIMNITMNQVTVNHFNTTKKNFPTIKKITDTKQKYVSPYSFKSIK